MKTTLLRDNSSAVPATVPADTIRLARLADAPAVAELIERSCLALASSGDERRHARGLLDAGLASQQRPIRDGTCYVAECGGRVIGVCAWSGQPDVAEVGMDRAGLASTARVRALAVHPGHPPLALSRLLLILCEAATGRQGVDWLEAVPTRPEVWLYLACGFRSDEPLEVRCPQDITVPCVLVRKPIRTPRPSLPGEPRLRYRDLTALSPRHYDSRPAGL